MQSSDIQRLGRWALALAVVLPSSFKVQATLNVAATLPDYGAIAQAVGGEKVKVTSFARGTEDPHFVDARPSFVTVLNKADVLIEGGLELEIGWLPPLVNAARNRKILADAPGHIILGRGIHVIEVPTGAVDRSMGDVHPLGNPHFWLDPENGGAMAAGIAAVFTRLDPANASYYEAHLARFNQQLEEKLKEWKERMAPFRGTKVITYHKSFDYFLERFGLQLVGTIEPKPGIEPSPTHISALVPLAKEAGVKLILIEPNRPRKTPETVAQAIGAKLVVIPAMVGGDEQAKDYFGLFDVNVSKIVGALKP